MDNNTFWILFWALILTPSIISAFRSKGCCSIISINCRERKDEELK